MPDAPGAPILLVADGAAPEGAALRALLERDGLTVETSPAERAVDLLRARAFDALVALATGTAGDGVLDLLARARRASPETPFVVAGATAELAARAVARGAVGLIALPADAVEARATIAAARLRRRQDLERAAMLEEARRTRRFFEDVLRGLREGILVIDAEGKIRYRNPEAARIIGEEDDEDDESSDGDDGSNGAVRLRQRALAPLMQLLVETFTEGEGRERTLVVEEDEQKLFLDAATSVLRDGDGRVTGAVGIVRDRSAEKLLEEQLVHTERLATLGSLLAAIAHEIASPLNVITGAAEIGFEAAREAEDAAARVEDPATRATLVRVAGDVRDVLEQVREAGIRCQTIAGNLLQYSRRVPAHVREEDPNELVGRTLGFVGKYLGIDRVEVKLELDPKLPKVRVDASQIQQALTNLIDNAVNAKVEQRKEQVARGAVASGAPRPKLSIRTSVEDGKATIRVSDEGPGIAPGRLEHLWRPFYTTKPSGTGLGLYITRKVIEHQGGTIVVESTVGKGTTFTIRIPL